MQKKNKSWISEVLNVPEDWKLRKIINIAKSRKQNKFDTVIAVTGYEGVGKSTLSIIIGANYDPKFTLQRNVFFNPEQEDLIKKMNKYDRGSTFSIDEAIDIVYKRNWHTRIQSAINQHFTKVRERTHLVLFNIPTINDMNTFFRKRRLLMNIEVVKRGKAALFVKSNVPREEDPFQLEKAKKVITDYLAGRKEPSSYKGRMRLIRKLPGYKFTFPFPKLPKSVEKEYMKLRDEAKEKLLETQAGVGIPELVQKQQQAMSNQSEVFKRLGVSNILSSKVAGYSKGAICEMRQRYPPNIRTIDKYYNIILEKIKKKLEREDSQH